MKQIILDYFRRWKWVLIAVACFVLVIGTTVPSYSENRNDGLFFVLMASMWAGGMLLQMDLTRGAYRPWAVLPVPRRQIGRALWLATVLIPALGLTALLFCGAAMGHAFNPNRTFSLWILAKIAIFSSVCLGALFPLRYAGGFVSTIILNGLGGIFLFGCIITCMSSFGSTVKFAVIVGLGSLLTIAGWLGANRFESSLAEKLPTRGGWLQCLMDAWSELKASKNTVKKTQVQLDGLGGIGLLVKTLLCTMSVALIGIGVFVAIYWFMMGKSNILPAFGPAMFPVIMAMTVAGLLPLLQQLRLLRTMPIGKTRLACIILGTTVVPVVCMGAVVWTLGIASPQAAAIFNGTVLASGLAALGASLAIWDGLNQRAMIMLMVVFGGMMVMLQVGVKLPSSLCSLIAVVCIGLSFWIIRYSIERRSKIYQFQFTPGQGWLARR